MNFKISFPILTINALIIIGYFILWKFDLVTNSFSFFAFLLFPFIFQHIRFKTITPLRFSKKQARFLFASAVLSQLSELLYFGIPLLGNLDYVDFGFPIVHHLSLMMWMLIIFAKKNQNLYLAIHIIYCLLIFNRQYILIGILSYLISVRTILSLRFKIVILALIILFLSFIGSLRNQYLDINFSPFEGFISLPLLEYYDFILFFIIGPINATFNNIDYTFSESLFNFWNTKPEWAIFMKYGLSTGTSFLLFYMALILLYRIIYLLFPYRRRFYLPILIIYTFLTFFSNVILSTVFLANFIVLEFILIISRMSLKSKTQKNSN